MDMGGSEMHAYDYRKKGKMTTKRRLQQCMRHRILSWPSHVSRCDLVTGPIVVYSDSDHKVDKYDDDDGDANLREPHAAPSLGQPFFPLPCS